MEKTFKHGDIHPVTGNIFWSYSDKNKTKEGWLTPEAYQRKTNKRKEWEKSEEGKKYFKNWHKKNKKKHNDAIKITTEKRKEEYPLSLLFTSIRSGAKRRKIAFEIDKNFIYDLWIKQNGMCYYTNIKMNQTCSKKEPFQVSIDRIDSSKGYNKENTVLCCQAINYMKNDYPIEIFNMFLKELIK
jgi:hypothetical protein